MDKHEALQTMVSAARKYSLAINDLRTLLLKLIVLSVKYVSKKALWDSQFSGADFVDWDMVDSQIKRNVLGGCAEWIALLAFCKWEGLVKHESAIQNQHPPLLTLRRHMRESSLDTGDKDAWTLTCKVFLLMLVQGLPSLHSLEMLTCGVFKRDTHTGCISLLANQVRCRVIMNL